MFAKGNYYVYILTNSKHSVFYIGVTNDLERRMYEHKHGLITGFTKMYHLIYLVYFELFSHIKDAIAREKQLKNWHRNWKINLIKQANSLMKDLTSA